MPIGINSQVVKDGLVKIDSQVNVDFHIFDQWNKDCYASGALLTDSGYCLGIRLRGIDNAGISIFTVQAKREP